MGAKRRRFGVAVLSLPSLSGCSEHRLSDENTPVEDSDITDIDLVNERSESIAVTVTATTDGAAEFEERVIIETGENEMFNDPLTDDTSATVTVTITRVRAIAGPTV